MPPTQSRRSGLRVALAGLPLMATLAAPAWAASTSAPETPEVFERTLDNGLKILVKPDRRAPVLTSQIWYKVGASYEHGGLTGISHVLEHMMFKGTETLGPGELSRIVAEHGGEENAFTGDDYTAYYQNLASDRLEVSFRLEADRMRNLALDPEAVKRELEVVKEERRMRTDDDPQALTYERFSAAAFDASPYGNPVIGWPGDLERIDRDALQAWYRKWYAPNNATLVVAGDVDPEAVFALAEKHFGPLRSESLGAPEGADEPPQLGEKRIRVKAPAQEPYLVMGYKAPSVGDAETEWEPYALEMLAAILDGGSSARLARELVRGSQVASSAGVSYSAFNRLPGLFLLSGVPAKGRDVPSLEQALLEQVERVREQPVASEELERVRTQTLADKIYKRDSVFYQGMQLGLLETVGLGWELADRYVDKLAAVTPEQVQAVARKYLVPDGLTVAVLDPQPMEAPGRPAMPPAALGGRDHVR